jgi:hypothetical protein
MDRKFTIIDEITSQYGRFYTVGTLFTVRHLPPLEKVERDPISYFMDSVTNLFEHASKNCDDSNIVGISIRNDVNMRDKKIGIRFTRKDQFSADKILNVWEKVTQPN